jgi:tetratricopeptide (TPR) repeat protein
MEAEEYFSIGEFQHAQEFYKRAILTARSHKFVNDEALSCELAARFYFETGDLTSSLEHFTLAHKSYCTWGAIEKGNRLFAYTLETFTNHSIDILPQVVSQDYNTNTQH